MCADLEVVIKGRAALHDSKGLPLQSGLGCFWKLRMCTSPLALSRELHAAIRGFILTSTPAMGLTYAPRLTC
jgi:hypothetical protein